VKKLISILVTLGVVLGLTLVAVAPVAAVDAPIEVEVYPPLAGQLADYDIMFHNGSLLLAGDWIDVMFPAGTNAAGAMLGWVMVSPDGIAWAPVAAAISAVGATYVRITLTDPIMKCQYVWIWLWDIVNPGACFHHLQVGSTTHTPVASKDYTIYSLRVCLTAGKHLFALPAYPEDEAIEVVLADLFAYAALDPDFEFSVWYWDACEGEWVIYASDTSFDDLQVIEPGKSYWIKVNMGICFYFKGVPYPDDQGPPVKFCFYCPCWNMVGVPSTTATLASEFLKSTLLPPFYTQYAVVAIYEWNGLAYVDLGWTGQFPAPVDPLLDANGEGYWMAFIESACIIPPLP
jgi:hypothetical protein